MKHDPVTSVRACPLCGAGADQAEPFLSDTRDESRVSASSFASRKVPEYMSHAMVRCRSCDLAYVDRPPSVASLAVSYHAADYDSAEEAEDAAEAYAGALGPVLGQLKGRGAALEIGTGTGAFLERLKGFGFADLIGVEPSSAAIAAAPAHRQPWIREGIFEEADFAPESFDLICCFMTLEHVQDPGALVASAYRLLRPGGVFVGVTHDRRAWLNRLLGRRSPIVDIEHMQLFSATSAKRLLQHNGYTAVGGASFRNSYRPSYWLRLVPMPDGIKQTLTRLLHGSWLDRHRLPVNVGNFMSWGFKPL
ncbi:class I SAM-dependent methyltransferase [Sphingobium bisphenolivorans]|uniref:class I SAM-dependent methyltransferase n=1 Tax=Sphingobium bisphenolivorans TaxID=1335760 RepID=UPI0005616D08|nr:class I SAM-dependent methyltransferase [Sphingobium bisphenolivorans]